VAAARGRLKGEDEQEEPLPCFISRCPMCPTFPASLWLPSFPTLPIHSTCNKEWLFLLILPLQPPPCSRHLPPPQATMLSMGMPLHARGT